MRCSGTENILVTAEVLYDSKKTHSCCHDNHVRLYCSGLGAAFNWCLSVGLPGVELWPEELFSLLWLAPLLILTTLQHLAGQPTLFTAMTDGDCRPAVSAALAALLCGFFWEMWNYYSLAKWTYNIPFVSRFRIFEMPILGYMGYLPFGLLCVAITELFKGCGSHRQ